MKTEDLAFVADALLALCEKAPEAPFYTDVGFEHKLRQARTREQLYLQIATQNGDDPLAESECREIFEAARLTDRQSRVLSCRLDGWTFEEIGNQTGHTKQAAQNIFIQAIKKLARAFYVYPFRGLSDTYRRELKRGSR